MAALETPQTREINYPRHILFLGPPNSGVLQLLQNLTGSAPIPRTIVTEEDPRSPANASTSLPVTTTAGLTHALPISTRYYHATIPIWIDETSSPEGWRSDFLSEEAFEVIRAVGAWVVVFRKSPHGWETAVKLMEAVSVAIKGRSDQSDVWNGVLLCVSMPVEGGEREARINIKTASKDEVVDALDSEYEEWEDKCFDLGFEFIDGEITGRKDQQRNAAGELRGTARLMEAFEANDWENVDDLDEDEIGLGTLGEASQTEDGLSLRGVAKDETFGFLLERQQMEQEFAGLKMAMAAENTNYKGSNDAVDSQNLLGDEQQQVEELERMMLRMQAAKDMSGHLEGEERKRFAKRNVDEVMRNIS